MKKLLGISALLVSILLARPAALHAASPALLPFQGYLTDSAGAPIDTTVTLTFSIYSAAQGGSMLFQEMQSARVDKGFFNVYIGAVNSGASALDPAIFDGSKNLYLGIKVNSDPELTPRTRIGSVPFAFFADACEDATTLKGQAASAYQQRVTGTCNSNQAIRTINADGSVTCETDVPYIAANNGGLVVNSGSFSVDYTATQSRVTGTCATGSSIATIAQNGSVTCEIDKDTTYSAANNGGVVLNGTAFSLAPNVAGSGLALASGVISLAPSTAGAGLAINNGVLSIASSAAGAGLALASGVLSVAPSFAGAGLSLSSGVLSLAAGVAGHGLTLTNGVLDITPDGSTPCTSGQMLKSNGSGGWACANDIDTNTTYGTAGGSGLFINGNNNFSVDYTLAQARVIGTCAAGSSIASVLQNGSVTCEIDNDTLYSATVNGGLTLNGTSFGLASSVAGTGLSLSSGVMSVATTLAGNGLTLTNGVLNVTSDNNVCSSGQVLKSIGSGQWTCTTDNDTTYANGSGLSLSGTTFSVATGGVTGTMIASHTIATGNIAPNAVTNTEIAPNAVTGTEIAPSSVGMRELDPASMPADTKTISGTLNSGVNKLISATFKMPANGKCLVHVSFTTSCSTSAGDFVQVSPLISVNGTTSTGPSMMVSMPIAGQTTTSTASTSNVFAVAAGTTVAFGCEATTGSGSSDLDNTSDECDVSWLCF